MSLKFTPIMMAMLLSFSINSLNLSFAKETTEIPNQNLTEKTSATEENRGVEISDLITINDPVATYNGIPISKEEFLDFVEHSTGERITEFSSKEELENLIKAYASLNVLSEEAVVLGLVGSDEAKKTVKVIENILLAREIEQRDPTARSLVEDDNSLFQDTATLHLNEKEWLLVANAINLPFPEEVISEDYELQMELEREYKKIVLLAEMAESLGLKNSHSFVKELEFQKKQYYITLILEEKVNIAKAMNKDIEKLYQDWKAKQEVVQYKVSQIVMEDGDSLKNVLDMIQNETISFRDAVAKYSEDALSKSNNGKIGRGQWVEFPAENSLSIELRKMDVGSLSSIVQGPIGKYHLLLLEDINIDNSRLDDFDSNSNFKINLWNNKLLNEFYEDIYSKIQVDIL